MYDYSLYNRIHEAAEQNKLDIGAKDKLFYTRFIANTSAIHDLYMELYGQHPDCEKVFDELIQTIIKAHTERSVLQKK